MKCSVVTLPAASESDSVLLTSKHPGKKTGRRKIPVKLLRRQKTQDSVKVRHQPMMVLTISVPSPGLPCQRFMTLECQVSFFRNERCCRLTLRLLTDIVGKSHVVAL